MTRAELLDLLAAMTWARDRLLTAVAETSAEELRRPLGGSFAHLEATLLHLYGAERIWTERLVAGGEAANRWPAASEFADLASFAAAWRQVSETLGSWIAAQPDDVGARMIEYRDTKGNRNGTRVAAIILQLSHHHAYHRGQIAHMLRQLGRVPPATDYIAFVRSRAATPGSTGRQP